MINIDSDRIINGEFNPENTQNLCFPTISLCKLFILSIITLGFYDIIWIYNLWKTIKNNFGYNNINTILRTLFTVFTIFTLFITIAKHINKYLHKSFKPVLFAILYILLRYAGNLPIPYCLITFTSVLLIINIQYMINTTNENYFPNAYTNEWNYANTIWTTIFGLIWFLVIYGLK